MSVYKKGQGKYTRMCTVLSGALIVAIGCFSLYRTLDAADIGLWVSTIVVISVVILLAAMLGIADFVLQLSVVWLVQ